ncbi:MAG: hypothetical protein CMB64_03685 [Euryarchaeota archaeon]|nr:hypothetical protein [Euryarchaeota archaeon]|tara:strand:- start:288 stop:2051 length:1764 start_codon:yes stop_codon:yes gene_type:complete
MGGVQIGLDISARQRHARVFKLGDRKNPASKTPALIIFDDEVDLTIDLAPFKCSRLGDTLPPSYNISGRAPLVPPFEKESPNWEFLQGHVYPPSLSETEGKSTGSITPVLSLSLQRMMHDPNIVDILPPSLIVVTDAIQLSNRSKEFVDAMLIIREKFPSSLIWCPGLSGPDNLALLTWLGVDLHDLSRTKQAHAAGVLLTSDGPRKINPDLEGELNLDLQINQWKTELANVRHSIEHLNLRELVEKRVLNSPKSVEKLRHHDFLIRDRNSKSLSRHVSRDHVLQCNSLSIRTDPIITEWIQRISSDYLPHESRQKLMILLPCSAKKPYRVSKSHKRFRHMIGNIAATELSVTSPLGIVPRELEELWPASNYDIPVTGHWDKEEKSIVISILSEILSRTKFELILNNSGFSLGDEFCGVNVVNCTNETLQEEVLQAKEKLGIEDQSMKINRLIEYRTISNWFYGNSNWLDKTKLSGKAPHWKIEQNGKPFARWNHLNSSFSFSKAALPVLAENHILPSAKIDLKHEWNGDVFAPMVVSFDDSIRSGDVILLFSKDDDLIGSAIAQAPAWEWNHGCGRLAKVRHRLSK